MLCANAPAYKTSDTSDASTRLDGPCGSVKPFRKCFIHTVGADALGRPAYYPENIQQSRAKTIHNGPYTPGIFLIWGRFRAGRRGAGPNGGDGDLLSFGVLLHS